MDKELCYFGNGYLAGCKMWVDKQLTTDDIIRYTNTITGITEVYYRVSVWSNNWVIKTKEHNG